MNKKEQSLTRKVMILGEKYSLREMLAGYLFIVPTIGFLIYIFIMPVVQVVELSFTNFNMATGEMKYIGLNNYRYLFESGDFWLSIAYPEYTLGDAAYIEIYQ